MEGSIEDRKMRDDFDLFVNRLQQEIDQEAKAALGEKGFERWLNPRYRGILENPDGYARITGSCGDTMQIYLKFHNDVVNDATYETDGCGSSGVCGSFAAELALGKNPDELVDITGDTILSLLGELPEEERHCAFLAAETLQAALSAYIQKGMKKSEKNG
jgi:nitrogen fixation NifU-like protein